MRALVCVVLALCGSVACVSPASQRVVKVSSDCTNASSTHKTKCTQLDIVLGDLKSNTALHLQPGDHLLQQYHGWTLRDLSHISIIGEDVNPVRIKCNNTGLAFINTTNLAISNVLIDGCGLTNASLQNATKTLKMLLDLDFWIPDFIMIGVFLAQCKNLNMSDTLVTNTRGLGLLGVNVVGESSLTNVNFTRNIRPHCQKKMEIFPHYLCQKSVCRGIGGGAYFLFEDLRDSSNERALNSTLLIKRCTFWHNADCSYVANLILDYQYLYNMTYMIGGGGGLSVFMPQTTFSVQVLIYDSTFSENDARYGGGAQIGLFAGYISNTVQFWNCLFENNGLSSSTTTASEEEEGGGWIDRSWARGGAGVVVYTDLLRHSDASKDLSSLACDRCKSVAFLHTEFLGNSASVQGGALLGYSLSRNFKDFTSEHNIVMSLNSAIFSRNSAKYGAAVYVSQRAEEPTVGSMILIMSHVMVEESSEVVPSAGVDTKGTTRELISALDLRGINLQVEQGKLVVINNSVSGIHMESSGILLTPLTSLVVQGNRAHRGGGIYMEGNAPKIIIQEHCTLTLRENVANTEGGGIYYYQPLSSIDDCFLSTSAYAYSPNWADILHSNITVEFVDNEAPLGSMVFGASLSRCTWAEHLNLTDEGVYSELSQRYESTFLFDPEPVGKRMVSSEPYKMTLSNASTYPGQALEVSISVFDMFGNRISTVLSSDRGFDKAHNLTLGSKGFWYLLNDAVFTPIYVTGPGDESVTLSLYATSNQLTTSVTMQVLDCPPGFEYDGNVTHSCNCSELVASCAGVLCDRTNMELVVLRESWLGCVSGENCTSTGDLVLLHCYFGHCSETITVFSGDGNSSCAPGSHRAGVRCGGCEDGYSARVGDFQCADCTFASFLFSLGAVCGSGLFIFLVVVFFAESTNNGLTYMIILFSNIVFPYEFYGAEKVISKASHMLIPAKLFSLDLKLGTCFVEGLTPLGSIGLCFLFPAYFFVLVGIFAVLCCCFSCMHKRFSPVRTLVAVILLTYTLTLKLCALTLSMIKAENLEGSKSWSLWLVDPNVRYFTGLHGLLASLSLVLIAFYLFPIAVLLFCPIPAYRYYTKKRFRTLLDAVWGPFTPRLRMWVGMRLLFQIFIALLPVFAKPGSDYKLVFVIAVFLFFQGSIKPFKDEVLNVLDNLLLVAAMVMHFFGIHLYVRIFGNSDPSPLNGGEQALVFITLALVYIGLLSTFLWYCRSAGKKSLSKLGHCFERCCCCCCRRARRGGNMTFDVVQRRTRRNATVHSVPTHSSVCIPESSVNFGRKYSWSKHSESMQHFTD